MKGWTSRHVLVLNTLIGILCNGMYVCCINALQESLMCSLNVSCFYGYILPLKTPDACGERLLK